MDVQLFLASNKPVECGIDIPPHSTVCIVDSSFNPPNYAHKKLAALCRKSFPGCYVIFMLATGNADKPAVEVDQLQLRVDMMKILATEEFPQDPKIGLALTTKARFIDKADVVKEVMPLNKLVFAMGYDTLLRLGFQQYYDQPLSEVLSEFFAKTDVLVLTRNKDGVSKMPNMEKAEEQMVSILKNSLWSQFHAKIYVHQSEPDTDGVSSSAARQSVESMNRLVPKGVAKYILERHLYGL